MQYSIICDRRALVLIDGILELNDRNFDLSHVIEKHINGEYLRSLTNVVPLRGAGDRTGRYCIGRFAIDMYDKLLKQRQQMHPTYCQLSVFLTAQDQVLCGIVHTCCALWYLAPTYNVACVVCRSV